MGKMVKVGPWGGNGGDAWDMGPADYINQFTIYYEEHIVGLKIIYTVDGKIHTGKYGRSTNTFKEIILNVKEEEYFTSISGCFHALSDSQENAIVMMLTLETNKGKSISVGDKIGSSFTLTLEEGGKILGFFGQVGIAIDAIGIYCLLPK